MFIIWLLGIDILEIMQKFCSFMILGSLHSLQDLYGKVEKLRLVIIKGSLRHKTKNFLFYFSLVWAQKLYSLRIELSNLIFQTFFNFLRTSFITFSIKIEDKLRYYLIIYWPHTLFLLQLSIIHHSTF